MNNDNFLNDSPPWVKNYDPHIPSEIHYPKTNLVFLFESTAKKFPDKPFLSVKNYEFSFGYVHKLVENLSRSLISLGLIKGDGVALILPNIPQFVIAYYAVLKAGGVVVAMNPNYKPGEFEFLFKDSGPKYVFCLDRHQDVIRDLSKKVPFKSVITTSIEDIPFLLLNTFQEIAGKTSESTNFLNFVGADKAKVFSDYPVIKPDDPAVFQYSGGTTGVPKAAIGMHKNLTANLSQFQIWCDLKQGNEVILAVIPLYHVYEMVLALAMSASIGAKLILVEDPKNIDLILTEIEKHKVTFYPGVPSMYYAINQNLKSKMENVT